MTIQADVDAQVTIDATTSAAAIAAATSAVSGYAFSIVGITIAATDFVSTDAVITELAVGAVHRHLEAVCKAHRDVRVGHNKRGGCQHFQLLSTSWM